MKKATWVLIGGETMLGKECREFVEMEKLPVELRLAGAIPEARVLSQDEGEIAVLEPLAPETLEGAEVVFLAGGAESGKAALAMSPGLKQKPEFIDVSGALEDLPNSRLRAPMLEEPGLALPAGTLHTLVHPAASALARLLTLIHRRQAIREAVVTIMEPVSAHGMAGIDELHKQAVAMFSFQQLPKTEFDAQTAFNLLPRFGDQAGTSLAGSATRIEKHLASLLGPKGIPLPSIRLVHAPVFHGYCQSVWIAFEHRPAVEAVENWLEEAGLDVRRASLEPASNAGVAGQGGITVSDIAADSSNASAVWIWMASDNIRTTAENAALTAGLLSRQRR